MSNLLTVFKIMALLYIATLIVLFFSQDKLIFMPQKITEEYAKQIIADNANIEEIIITTPDDVSLHGWLAINTDAGKSPLIIYFGGNAEEVSRLIHVSDKFSGYSLLLMNYRGYGLSRGAPDEKSITADAELIFDEIIKRPDIDGKKIVVMGRSIGAGVAIHIAKQRDVKGVILITPYDSLLSVAQNKFRIVPMSLILRSRFDSITQAPVIQTPMLALIAQKDTVIPTRHAINLVSAWGGKTEQVIIKGAGHNTIHYSSLYWDSIKSFLGEIR